MKHTTNKKIVSIVTVGGILCLALGVLIGKFYFSKTVTQIPQITSLHQKGDFKFINPLLLVNIADKKDFTELKSFGNKIQSLVDQKKSSGAATDIGVYFRDFSSGHWTGVNEDHNFYPASLMKVPLMFAYFKEAEDKPEVLDQKLFYDGKLDLNQSELTKPENPIKAGQYYTVTDLIKAMIIDSDNNATNLLSNNIDQGSFNEIYTDLGQNIPNPTTDNTDYLSPKQYSTYFRILRNSTYLSTEYSEEALNILSQVDFKNGLVAGMPSNTLVSHKFGELEATSGITGQTTEELHDCGIVYLENHDYLLCVMTKGTNRKDLEQDIKDVSSLVYNEVMNNYK